MNSQTERGLKSIYENYKFAPHEDLVLTLAEYIRMNEPGTKRSESIKIARRKIREYKR